MKNKIYTLLFAVATSIGIMNAEIHTGTCGAQGDNLTWTLDTETGVLTISGTGDMEDFDWICSYTYDPAWNMNIGGCYSTVPWNSYRRFIKSLVLPDKVKTIGNHAFTCCDSLTSVIIPESVTNIGDSAFADCSSLTIIYIPNSVTSIGKSAFYQCGRVKEVHISDLVAWCKISFVDSGSTPFTHNAPNLCLNGELVTDLVIPNSVTSIGNYAFLGCSSLTSVTIPNSVTSIGDYAFRGCSGLTSISIPNSVTSIGDYAFWGCSGLTSVSIGNSVTSIEDGTFYGCSSLTSVTIPSSVMSIGDGSTGFYGLKAFGGCKKIESIYYAGTIEDWCSKLWSPKCFVYSDSSYSLYIDGAIVTDLVIPNNVEIIGEEAFYGCGSLTSITIPNSVTSIERRAFRYCNSLTSATICMTNINMYAFFQCRSIKSVTISNSVKHIEAEAFTETSLDTLIVQSTTPPEIEEHSIPWYSNLKIFIPCHTLKAYQAADYWYLLSGDGYTGYRKLIENGFTLTSIIDEEEYSKILLCDGEEIVFPTKEGHTFVPSEEIPELMPEHDLTIKGTFSVNSYDVIYIVDNEEYQRVSIPYGTPLTAIAPATREGYTFRGWSKLPATMPANDITVTGYFTANYYMLTYLLDGEEYYHTSITYGTPLTAIAEPSTRKGYTFSGWNGLPATMPANDVTITGSFTANNYTLIYMLDGEEYYRTSITYGTPLTAIAAPATRKGYTFSGWSKLPATMPANDITVIGSFTANIYVLIYMLDGEEYYRTSVTYSTPLTAIAEPVARKGYTFSGWNGLPATMPANDVTVTGSFTANQYTITVIVNETKAGYAMGGGTYDYGKTVTIEAVPATGYRFVEWNDGNTDNPRTITVTENMTFTARFEKIPDALEDANADSGTASPRKVQIDGILYILMPDGRMYDLHGTEIK